MVSYDDTTGSNEYPLYHHLPELSRGFYEGYQIGKNSLGENFPTRPRKSDSYGGETIWGQIDAILTKYHCSLEELMWGFSWANVNMMLADAQRTDYESKHEDKSIDKDDDVLDLSNLADIEKLRRIAR